MHEILRKSLKVIIDFIIFNSHKMKIFDDLVADVFGPTLKFLKSDCCPVLLTDVGHHTAAAYDVAPRIQEVGTFI